MDAFTDIDYTLTCVDIVITVDDSVNQVGSDQVSSSKFTNKNLGTDAVELYRMDGTDRENNIPKAALDEEPYSCTIAPLATNFDIAHVLWKVRMR